MSFNTALAIQLVSTDSTDSCHLLVVCQDVLPSATRRIHVHSNTYSNRGPVGKQQTNTKVGSQSSMNQHSVNIVVNDCLESLYAQGYGHGVTLRYSIALCVYSTLNESSE